MEQEKDTVMFTDDEADDKCTTAQAEGVAVVDEDEYEYYELEYSEDDIVYYIEDEDGNELGFAVLEDGVEVEYYYADDEEGLIFEDEAADVTSEKTTDKTNVGITRESVAELTTDLNAVIKDGVAVASEVKDVVADLSDTFSVFKRKK